MVSMRRERGEERRDTKRCPDPVTAPLNTELQLIGGNDERGKKMTNCVHYIQTTRIISHLSFVTTTI